MELRFTDLIFYFQILRFYHSFLNLPPGKSKFESDDGNLSDASDLPLHGQQAIEGLEFDDDCLAVQTQNAIDSQKRNTALRHSTPTTDTFLHKKEGSFNVMITFCQDAKPRS